MNRILEPFTDPVHGKSYEYDEADDFAGTSNALASTLGISDELKNAYLHPPFPLAQAGFEPPLPFAGSYLA